jgi:ABC-type glycerol-3-phosphate transport system permease component
MLIFSTTAMVPTWIPVSAGYGWIRFRVQGGGFIQAFCVIYNQVSGTGYTIPAYHQDTGF